MATAGSWPVNLHWELGTLTGGVELCHRGGINCIYSRRMPKIQAIHTDGRICLGHGDGGSSDERGEIVNSCLLLASQFFRRPGQKDEKAERW